jgi:hypothetical protein
MVARSPGSGGMADSWPGTVVVVFLAERIEGRCKMNKRRGILVGALVAFLGIQTPQFAQDSSTDVAKADHARRAIAIGLLRTINTAEVSYRQKNGSFATWQTLLSSEPKLFDGFLSVVNQRENPNLHFSDLPEVLPGWNLRLNVHSDGRGFDVMLKDTTDEKCGYAALTDESGLIRQSKVIDCQI